MVISYVIVQALHVVFMSIFSIGHKSMKIDYKIAEPKILKFKELDNKKFQLQKYLVTLMLNYKNIEIKILKLGSQLLE